MKKKEGLWKALQHSEGGIANAVHHKVRPAKIKRGIANSVHKTKKGK